MLGNGKSRDGTKQQFPCGYKNWADSLNSRWRITQDSMRDTRHKEPARAGPGRDYAVVQKPAIVASVSGEDARLSGKAVGMVGAKQDRFDLAKSILL